MVDYLLKINSEEKNLEILECLQRGAKMMLLLHKNTGTLRQGALELLVTAAMEKKIIVHNEIPPDSIFMKEEISRSCSCIVYRGLWKNSCEVLVKKINPSLLAKKEFFLKEVILFSLLRHECICPFYGASTLDENSFILVFKYMSRGKLSDCLVNWKQDLWNTSMVSNMALKMVNLLIYFNSLKMMAMMMIDHSQEYLYFQFCGR
eukprot:TRINITY_DN5194_c0_g2_i1.p1 TRINITY_DN5194_c0_g2~~TRINITY_DN5194_c0_g2_i1.p1  ORF type:complete len:205 (-),score=44.81 TRINITY_DN5194_c0_g2_i1:284-898(-)